jgi:hypothetical protein
MDSVACYPGRDAAEIDVMSCLKYVLRQSRLHWLCRAYVSHMFLTLSGRPRRVYLVFLRCNRYINHKIAYILF